MGDTTFNHIFGGTETAMGMQPTQGSPTLSPADLDGLFKRANKATDVLRSVIKARIESPGMIAHQVREVFSAFNYRYGTSKELNCMFVTDVTVRSGMEPVYCLLVLLTGSP